MAEVSSDATLIIATSWQALARAETGDERTMICNCTVIIVFAAFFIEANLNHIIDRSGMTVGVNREFDVNYSGLQTKLRWFYNSFATQSPIKDKAQLDAKLTEEFPGFDEIRKFRNKVAHGVIDRSLANLSESRRLRAAAKTIVDRLFAIAEEAGHDIPRGVAYQVAISSHDMTDLPDESED